MFQVGFDANNGYYYSVEGSLSQDIGNIVNRSNVGRPGRFVFRIDGTIQQFSFNSHILYNKILVCDLI